MQFHFYLLKRVRERNKERETKREKDKEGEREIKRKREREKGRKRRKEREKERVRQRERGVTLYDRLLASPTNIRLSCKGLPETNTENQICKLRRKKFYSTGPRFVLV